VRIRVRIDHRRHEFPTFRSEILLQGGDHLLHPFPRQGVFYVLQGVHADQADDATGHEPGGFRDHRTAHGVADQDDPPAVRTLRHRPHILSEGAHGISAAGKT